METQTYQQSYYISHKKELNRARLQNYHRQRNNIPHEFFESYVVNKKLYNLLKKQRDTLDKELVFFLLQGGE